MLNRVLDGTREASPAVVAMVDQAFYTLPQLLAALRGTAAVDADLEGMQALADRIAEGEEAMPAFAAPGEATPGSTPVEAEVDAEDEAEAVEGAAAQAADTPAGEGTLPASVEALLLASLYLQRAVEGQRVDVSADPLVRGAITQNTRPY